MEKENTIIFKMNAQANAKTSSEKIKKRIETVEKYLSRQENDKAFDELESIIAEVKLEKYDFETIQSLLACMIKVKENTTKKETDTLFYQLRIEVITHLQPKQQSQILAHIAESYTPDEDAALWYLTEALTLCPDETNYIHRLTLIENSHYLAQFKSYSLLVKELDALKTELPKQIDSFMKNKDRPHKKLMQLYLDVKRLFQHQPPSTAKEWQTSYEHYQTFLEEYSKQLARRIELFFLRQQKNNEDLDLTLYPNETLNALLEELHDSLRFILGWENQTESKQQDITRTILRKKIWNIYQKQFASNKHFSLLEKCFINLEAVPFPITSYSQLWVNARWMHQNAQNNFFAYSADIIKAQENYQKSFFDLLQLTIKSLSQSLIPPPCDWGLYLTGSRARGDASPRSDLDITLIIANEKYLNDDFFKALLKGIQSLIIALGDCWQWTEHGFQATGIQIDSGDLTHQTIGAIQTPGSLAQKVTSALQNPNEKDLRSFILAFSLLIVKPVYTTKDELLSHYQASLKQALASIHLPKVGWSILKSLQKTRYPLLKDYLSSFHLMGLAFCCFEAMPPFFVFQWQNIYPLYAKYLNPVFAKQCIDDLHQLYRIRKTFHETHFTQEIPIQDLPEKEQTFLKSMEEPLNIFFEGLPEHYSSIMVRPYCPYQAYVGKHYQTLSDEKIIQLLKTALAQKEIFELPLSLIEHLQALLAKEFLEKQFNDLSLFDLCVATGVHPDTPIHYKSFIEHAFEQKNVSAITALLQKGAGQYTHFPMTQWVAFLEKTTPQTCPTLLSIWSKHNAFVNWYCSKQILFEPVPQRERTKEELTRFIEGIEVKQQLLKAKVYQQIFETKNAWFSTYQEGRKDNLYGRRAVTKIQLQEQLFFFKFFPEAALMEDAVQQFAHAYFPGTVPHSELIRYENDQGEVIPILISEGIRGYNLQDIFNALSDELKVRAEAFKKGISKELAQSCFENIDHYSFSQQVLLTLFTNDEDGKPDNKYLVPFQQGDKTSYRIVSIDNDHSFLEPLYIDEKGNRILQLKSILFCLDNMKRLLHPQAVAEFLKLNPTECIEKWLTKLLARQEHYFKLFDSREKNPDSVRELLLTKDVILQLIFPKKSIAKLWEKWTHAQSYLNQQVPTGLELLHRVMPEVGLFYLQAFKEPLPFARFDSLAGKSYTSILIGKKISAYSTKIKSSQLLTLQGVSSKALTQKGNGLGPRESLAELEIAKLEHTKLEDIFKQIMQGQFEAWTQLHLDNNKVAVINRLNWKKLNLEKRKELFDLLIASKLNTNEFILNHCDLLNIQTLDTLLQKMSGLQQLTIVDSNLNDYLWGSLSNYCGTIQSLKLINMRHLFTTEQGFFYKSASLSLFELTELTLENIPQLHTLKINTPKLKTFICKNLPELIAVETQSTELETFMFQGTPTLNLEGLANSFETITPFKKGLLPEHWQQDNKLALYITYPFLLSKESFKWVPQFSKSCIELLKSFPKEMVNSENLLKLKQLLQIHCKQLTLTEKILSKLLIALKDSDSNVRDAAARALGNLGQYTTETIISALLITLKDSDSNVRSAAAQALGSLGPNAATEPVLAALRITLNDSNWDVRGAAARALGNLGPNAATETVIAALLSALKYNFWSSFTIAAAAQALGNLGPKAATEPVIAALLLALRNSYSGVREAAAQALGNLGAKAATEPVIAALLSALNDSEWQVCKATAQTLGNFGPKAATEPVVKALLVALKHTDSRVRSAAAQALGNLGPDATLEPVIAAFLRGLKDSEEVVRSYSAQVLGSLGPMVVTEPVIAALLTALNDNDSRVRKAAIQALGNLGPKGANELVIVTLLTALNDSDSWIRKAAIQTLGNLGPKAANKPVIAALLIALNNSDSDVSEAIVKALVNLGQYVTEPVIAAFLSTLKDSDARIRSAAAQALGNLGLKAANEPVIAALLSALNDSERWVREAAAKALGNFGPQAATEPVIAALLSALKDNEYVRSAAALALGNIGLKAATEPVFAALLSAFKDSEGHARYTAAQTLGNLGPKAANESIIATFLIALNNNDSDIRKTAAYALANLAQSTNQAYQSSFDTLLQQKNIYLAELHKMESTVSESFTETQLIEQLKKTISSNTQVMKIKIHGLKTQNKETLLLIQKLIEQNPPSLIHLNLEQNVFDEISIKNLIIETLPKCTQLQYLNLSNHQLTYPAMEKIAQLFNHCPIQNLILNDNQISTENLFIFPKSLPKKAHLHYLALNGNPLNKGISYLADMTEQLSNAELYLDNTQLDDSAWPTLKILLPKLKVLSLKQNQLSNMEHLIEILPKCTELTHLFLQGNLFSFPDLQKLLKQDFNPELKQHLQQQLENKSMTQLNLFTPLLIIDSNEVKEKSLEFS